MNPQIVKEIQHTMETPGWKHIEEFMILEIARAKEQLTKPKIPNPYIILAQIEYDVGYFLGIKSLKKIIFLLKCLLTKDFTDVNRDRRFLMWQGIYRGLGRLFELKKIITRRK